MKKNKSMIDCFMREAYEQGYIPCAKDLANFEELCKEVVAVRADGMEAVPAYLAERNLTLAMADYNIADEMYYREIIEMFMDRAKEYRIRTRLKDTCSIYDYDGDLEETEERERDIAWEIDREYAEQFVEETPDYTWQDFYDSVDDITFNSDYISYYDDRF